MEKLRKIPARAATESTEQPKMTASGAETRSDGMSDGYRHSHYGLPTRHVVLRQGGLRASLPTVVAGVCVCVHFGKQIAGVLLLGRRRGLALGRATPRYGDTVTDPAALARRHISTYPTCTRTTYSIYSAFYSCGLAVHLSNDPSSP
jgi:hypothetical protein